MVEYNLPSRYENVEFDCLAESVLFRFRLHVFRGMMYASVYADNELVVGGQRCIGNEWLIPSGLLVGMGNFRFEVNGDEYPWWENFGNGVRLVYYTASEIREMKENG